MRISLCLNATGISKEAHIALAGGPDALSRSLERLGAFTPPEGQEIVGRWAVVDPDTELPGELSDLTIVRPREKTLSAFLDTLHAASDGADVLLIVPADGPFWDPELARRLLTVHKNYVAEYTFADGFPEGLAPEVVSREILPALLELSRRYPDINDRHTLFEILQKDINAFDVETELSSVDMRMLRIRLRCDNRRNRLLCEALLGNTGSGGLKEMDADALAGYLNEHQEILRTIPAYLSVQVTSRSSQKPFYLPDPFPFEGEDREMSPGDFQALVTAFLEFAPDGVVSVSTWGEIALHSRVAAILEVSNRVNCRQFLVETSGVGWSDETVKEILSGRFPSITWIVDLDAYSQEVYSRVRGEGYQEAIAFATGLLERFPENVYVQSTRMKENEEDLESFYREWKKVTGNVIIQKYDHFCTRLPDRRVVDNAPVARLPCWHLKRDMTVLVDGTVPMCREDLAGDHVLGNALREPLQAIWLHGEPLYQQHVRGDYPELCRKCDEYYTFNF